MGARLIGMLAVIAVLASTQMVAAEKAGNGAASAKPTIFHHPTKEFVIAVPPNARADGQSGKVDVAIQSRAGYLINLQTGAINPRIDLRGMLARLEATYLGQGRAWAVKLDEGELTVAGMPARAATYEGSNTRTRVVVARGRSTDYVFMFFAPPGGFNELVKEFDWVLETFRPAPRDLPPLAVETASNAPVKSAEPTARNTRDALPAEGLQHFSDAASGFSIDYPADWIVEHPSTSTVMFSGREGTEAFYAVVSIRNLEPPSTNTPADAAANALALLKTQITGATSEATYFGEGTLIYDSAGLRLEGHQFLVTYTRDGQRFQKWAVIVPRPGGGAVHIWSYTAPEQLFAAYRPAAEAMRMAWKIRQ